MECNRVPGDPRKGTRGPVESVYPTRIRPARETQTEAGKKATDGPAGDRGNRHEQPCRSGRNVSVAQGDADAVLAWGWRSGPALDCPGKRIVRPRQVFGGRSRAAAGTFARLVFDGIAPIRIQPKGGRPEVAGRPFALFPALPGKGYTVAPVGRIPAHAEYRAPAVPDDDWRRGQRQVGDLCRVSSVAGGGKRLRCRLGIVRRTVPTQRDAWETREHRSGS